MKSSVSVVSNLTTPAVTRRSGKRSTNVYLTAENVDAARRMNINLSATLDAMLAEAVRQKQQETRKDELRAGIQAFNAFEREAGLFTDDDEYGVL